MCFFTSTFLYVLLLFLFCFKLFVLVIWPCLWVILAVMFWQGKAVRCTDYGGPLIDPARVLSNILASMHDPETGALKVMFSSVLIINLHYITLFMRTFRKNRQPCSQKYYFYILIKWLMQEPNFCVVETRATNFLGGGVEGGVSILLLLKIYTRVVARLCLRVKKINLEYLFWIDFFNTLESSRVYVIRLRVKNGVARYPASNSTPAGTKNCYTRTVFNGNTCNSTTKNIDR